MFQSHPEFEQIENSERLWRYQDLPRYIDLLLKNQMFFSRADKFEDPFEGRYNKSSSDELLKAVQHEEDFPEKNVEQLRRKTRLLKEQYDEKRTSFTINSWHINKDENYAMWKIYAKGSYGIALETTYERLKHCFDVTNKVIHIGKVIYYNESCDPIPLRENSFLPFLRKRFVYQYENEMRCCHVLSHRKDEKISWQQQDVNNGVFIPVNLDTLIERIYISPYSPKWIEDIVSGINKKFGMDKEIVHSKVFESADYL